MATRDLGLLVRPDDAALAVAVRTLELAADAVSFRLGRTTVRVGRLEKLLRSKKLSGRPKDIEFLRLYRARFEGEG